MRVNVASEIVSDVLVDAEASRAHLIEYLVNKAVARDGNLIRRPQSVDTWVECFTLNNGILSFWYDTEDGSTHCVNLTLREEAL